MSSRKYKRQLKRMIATPPRSVIIHGKVYRKNHEVPCAIITGDHSIINLGNCADISNDNDSKKKQEPRKKRKRKTEWAYGYKLDT